MESKAMVMAVLLLVSLMVTSPLGIHAISEASSSLGLHAGRGLPASVLLKSDDLEMSAAHNTSCVSSEDDCIGSGGFCLHRPMDCCGNCACLIPPGICFGTDC